MSDVIAELSGEQTLNAAHVVRRVDDWKRRVSSLYDQIRAWLPAHVSADTHATVRMEEAVMREFGIAAAELPVLNIQVGGKWVAKLVPRGLWIIGANGRLDLFTTTRQAIIVDRADVFGKPVWEIAPANNRRHVQSLTAETWRKVVDL